MIILLKLINMCIYYVIAQSGEGKRINMGVLSNFLESIQTKRSSLSIQVY